MDKIHILLVSVFLCAGGIILAPKSDRVADVAPRSATPVPNKDATALTVEEQLDAINQDWRVSIHHCLKNLGRPTDLAYRKALARKNGYSGSYADTAKLNVFLLNTIKEAISSSNGDYPIPPYTDAEAALAEEQDARIRKLYSQVEAPKRYKPPPKKRPKPPPKKRPKPKP